jgi:hypothetical protein
MSQTRRGEYGLHIRRFSYIVKNARTTYATFRHESSMEDTNLDI